MTLNWGQQNFKNSDNFLINFFNSFNETLFYSDDTHFICDEPIKHFQRTKKDTQKDEDNTDHQVGPLIRLVFLIGPKGSDYGR